MGNELGGYLDEEERRQKEMDKDSVTSLSGHVREVNQKFTVTMKREPPSIKFNKGRGNSAKPQRATSARGWYR